MADLPEALSPTQVSLVLQRAAELDARGESVTADELIKIAEEAGLDSSATAAAIREVLGSPTTQLPRASDADRTVKGMFVGTAVGGMLGLLAAYVPALGLLSFSLAAVYALIRMVQGQPAESRLAFLLQNFVLWMVFITAASIVGGTAALLEVQIAAMTAWVISSVLGLVIPRSPVDPLAEADHSPVELTDDHHTNALSDGASR